VAGGLTLVILATAFSLHALDVAWAWLVYPLGFGGLLPLALGWARRSASQEPDARDPAVDGLDELHLQYVRGELDETEFERRLETVLERETGTREMASRPNGWED
jgi:hypothetical protein